MLDMTKRQMEIKRQNDMIRTELEKLLVENEINLLYVENIQEIIEM